MSNPWLVLGILAVGLGLLEIRSLPASAPADPPSPPPSGRFGGGRRTRTFTSENEKNNRAIKAVFRETVAPASAATVRILANGQAIALGTVVDANGYIVTKASLLKDDLICRFNDGRELTATVVGDDPASDLALLHVNEKGLAAVAWRTGPLPPPGSFLAAVGTTDNPLAIGVVSTDPRRIRGPTRTPSRPGRQSGPGGWLGITVVLSDNGGIVAEGIVRGSPAEKAGLKSGDIIKTINGQAMTAVGQVLEMVGSNAPGSTLKISAERDDRPVELTVTLGRPSSRTNQAPEDNWGGGPFSERRWGFASVLPHDLAILPGDCGGPLVDTEGKVVGINIARALRVSSFALPAETVQRVVADLLRAEAKPPGPSPKNGP